jgi:hypothetical protein
MVRSEQGYGIIQKSFLTKRSQYNPHLVVDVCAHRVEGTVCGSNLMVREVIPRIITALQCEWE